MAWSALAILVPVLLGAGTGRFGDALVPVGPGGEVMAPRLHDLHVVYADLAVEGAVIAGRLRFFKHDLERALGPLVGADAVSLSPGPEADALVLRYLRERLAIEIEDEAVEPKLMASGEDEFDRHAVWWITIRYRAALPVVDVTVRNTLLFEVFDDQRNVMNFVHFPDESPQSFSFAAGEEEHRVRFGEPYIRNR